MYQLSTKDVVPLERCRVLTCVLSSCRRRFVMSRQTVQRRALEAELAEMLREEQREKRKPRDAASAAARQCSFNGSVLHAVLIINALSEGAATPGAKYVAGVGTQQKWHSTTKEELEAIVYDTFTKADLAALVAFTD